MNSNTLLRYISAFSIVFAVLIGLVKFRNLLNIYRPFFYFCLLALLNEIASIYMVKYVGRNTVNNNIYLLLEMMILLYQFFIWDEERSSKYLITCLVLFVIWFIDNLIIHALQDFTSFYSICYYLILLFSSVYHIREAVRTEHRNIFSNPRFLICSALLIYFSFNAFLELFFEMKISMSPAATVFLLSALRVINLFINFIYAWAFLCIPMKLKSTSLPLQE